MVKKAKNIVFAFFTILLFSCQSLYTEREHYYEIDEALGVGDTSKALELLESNKNNFYAEKDRVLYYLEIGMLHRYNGEYEKSNEALTKAEYAIEELLTTSISKGILSGVLNDNALDYPGEDYEDIYINVFKSLNYINLEKYEEALVEVRRVNNKLNYLEDKYSDSIDQFNNKEELHVPKGKFDFHNDALARYLGVIAYRMDRMVDDSRIEQDKLLEAYRLQSHLYNFPTPTIPKKTQSDDKVLLNLFAFTGLPPEKIPETLRISSGSGSLLIMADSNTSEDTDTFLGFNSVAHSTLSDGINVKIQIPRLVKRESVVSKVEVIVDGYSYGYLEKIESLDNIAIETFKAKQPLIVGKTVIRALAKAIVSESSQSVIEENYGAGWGLLAGLAGDIYMNVTENSDLRLSRYFPSNISGLELELEKGIYNISLIYYDHYGSKIYQKDFIDYSVDYSKVNILESTFLR